MVADELLGYVRSALPAPPARVLEIGAGEGELALALTEIGYTVTAIDPASTVREVLPVALHELDAEPASFDAAVAVLSLHHVEPLERSCARLAEVVRPGGLLVVDEYDMDRLDERAAGWWVQQRRAIGAEVEHEPAEIVRMLREHLHGVAALRDALAAAFAFGAPVRGPFLYRWDLEPALRAPEEAEIARGTLPATGARFIAARR